MTKRIDAAFSTKPIRSAKDAKSPWRVFFSYAALGLIVVAVLAGLYCWDRFGPTVYTRLDTSAPPKLNANTPPGNAPEGMVWIPGGDFSMGIDDSIIHGDDLSSDMYKDARDVHKVYVDGFWMDQHEMTNERYAKFVEATGYQTLAERKPDAKDFPGVPASELVPFSLIFKKPAEKIRDVRRAHAEQAWWDICKGASWKAPNGPGSDVKGMEKYPAVHIAYDDAVAYCNWAGKRLPTEAEWEFAARGGLDRAEYCWGKELKVDGKWMCNAWQGDFPNENTKEDGFEGIAPVGQYPPNGYGLHDMAGNVWEWCSDWYQAEYYLGSPARNPKGPKSSFDASEPQSPKRIQRGGSFFCADNYCRRYIPGARGKGEPSSAANHVGFRCVMDPVIEAKKR